MDIIEEFGLYDQLFHVDNPKVDSHHMLLYKFPDTLKEPGIYNILEHIKCIPVNVTLLKNFREELTEGPYCNLSMPRDISNVCAIIEFADKATLDRAFYIINHNYSKYMKAQYTFVNLKKSSEQGKQLQESFDTFTSTTISSLTLPTIHEPRETVKLDIDQCLHKVYCFMEKSQVKSCEDQQLVLNQQCVLCASELKDCIDHLHYLI